MHPTIRAAALAAATLATSPATADLAPITAPSGYENSFGTSNNCMIHCMPEGSRFQQVYDATLFGNDPFFIRAIAFRYGTGGYGALDQPISRDLTVTLSTTTKAVDGLSPLWAENTGSDATIVRNGIVTFASGAGTTAFDQIIWFDTDFFYDPAVGNLLLDVTHNDPYPFNLIVHYFDAVNLPNDGVSRITGFASSDEAPPIGVDTLGLITQFIRVAGEGNAQPVPEPGTLGLVLAGLALHGAASRTTRRT